MGNYDNIKTLLIFFSPLIFRQTRSLYRSLRTSLSHRPAPRPLPNSAAFALNILFITICVTLFLSLPASTGINPHAPSPNIFTQTNSRLNTPTELLFSRLARHYRPPTNTLTESDLLLKSKFTIPSARKIYLRFGPDTLTNCPFCTPDNEASYLIYYLPFHTLLPHLLHMFLTGLITSRPLTGASASRWRGKFTLAALLLFLLETLLVSMYDPNTHGTGSTDIPSSFHNRLTSARFLSFTLFDATCAAIIWLTATHRFFYKPPSPAQVAEKIVSNVSTTLAGATAKAHALSVVRNATVRDRVLKGRDDAYWRTVVAMEGSGADGNNNNNNRGSIWEEEEVVRAMTRVMQRRNASGKGDEVDLGRLGVEAGSYVDGVTAGLEREEVDGDDGGDESEE
ncbi:hypothetical protein AJ79_06050 [Helicocarpus griseus UAMH5409]|uniref:Uncharacterized protein n=1 Tax=Helicocarpus griseus UAMH5409 TaxID=1447875 RepID=A0A2B7X9B8_9EURO|nr:hypothetical protein AJ79_06050 [Helicocarpus griseus UAMH5409]